MKTLSIRFTTLCATLLLAVSVQAQVVISNVPSTPHPSAMLDVQSTTKGTLITSMTLAQRDAIPTPADGLTIWNTSTGKHNYYDAFLVMWHEVASLSDIPTNFWYSSGNEVYLWPYTNVGIGTYQPDARLHVVGDPANLYYPSYYDYNTGAWGTNTAVFGESITQNDTIDADNIGVAGFAKGSSSNNAEYNIGGFFKSEDNDAYINHGVVAFAEGNSTINLGGHLMAYGDTSNNIAIETYAHGIMSHNTAARLTASGGTNATGASINASGTANVHGIVINAYDGTSNRGVSASAFNYSGTPNNYGIKGNATSYTNLTGKNYGVHGSANGSSGLLGNYGVYGEAIQSGITADNFGVYGAATDPDGAGVYSGYAGWFAGNTHIAGTLSKSGGTFKIDHPQDPANRTLSHSFVESPDMMNIYNGNITTDANGDATIELPAYFESLNKDFRYQLTVIGTFAQAIVGEKVSGNHFKIKTNQPNVEVSWQVMGIRKDAWAEANRVVPEQEKRDTDKGKYLNPEVFGQPKSNGIGYVAPTETPKPAEVEAPKIRNTAPKLAPQPQGTPPHLLQQNKPALDPNRAAKVQQQMEQERKAAEQQQTPQPESPRN